MDNGKEGTEGTNICWDFCLVWGKDIETATLGAVDKYTIKFLKIF